MSYLEESSLKYIIADKMTKNVKNICYSVKNWQAVDDIYSTGEIEIGKVHADLLFSGN